MERFFLVYKTVNKVKGEYYIGTHVTHDLNDSYLGSGKLLNRCIKKYGREVFERYALAVFDNSEAMFRLEAELVNVDTLNDPLCLNLKVGGYGGWHLKDANILWSGENQAKRTPFNKKEWRDQNAEKIAEWVAKGTSNGRKKLAEMRLEGWSSPGFVGHHHTEEHKQKMSEVMSVAQAGEKNSQYGKCWIHSLSERKNMIVMKEDVQTWLDRGWTLGRKMKFD